MEYEKNLHTELLHMQLNKNMKNISGKPILRL